MKTFANISEQFSLLGEEFVSSSVSAKFLTKIDNITIAGPLKETPTEKINSRIPKDDFVSLPFFNSAESFIRSFCLNRNFRNEFLFKVTENVKTTDKVWVRAPSIDSLVVAHIALRHNKPIIMHIAGNIDGVWKNKKYNFLNTILAFFMAQLVKCYMAFLSNNKHVYILSTGNDINNRYINSKNGSHLFFDTCMNPPSANVPIIDEATDKSTFKMLYIGRLEHDKGIVDFLYVLNQLVNSFQDNDAKFILTVVGHGSAETDFLDKVNELKLNEYVNFIGFVNSDLLSSFYLSNDLLIFPSVAPEGFPRVIQESWLHSLPVLTSDTGGITGVAIHDHNSFIFPAGNYSDMYTLLVNLFLHRERIDLVRNNLIKVREKFSSSYQLGVAIDRINSSN